MLQGMHGHSSPTRLGKQWWGRGDSTAHPAPSELQHPTGTSAPCWEQGPAWVAPPCPGTHFVTELWPGWQQEDPHQGPARSCPLLNTSSGEPGARGCP
ncbi:hypothetical protein LUU34_01367300 [Aix galericulata]|nr:hypothetical protein LUU34_01367300 [Aix galericulata]